MRRLNQLAPARWAALVALSVAIVACDRNQTATTTANGTDPAAGNLAPADQSAQPAQDQNAYAAQTATSQRAAYPQPQNTPPPPPAYSSGYSGQSAVYSDSGYYDYPDDASAGEPVVEATEPPPPLPEYSQPPCPGENYMWTPGYWDSASAGYYWVPGAWVLAPYTGALWTPPYWSFASGRYRWHRGYWASHIGFYGGINYGYGYTGRGFYGGYWRGGDFVYNRAASNVNTAVIRNVYNYRAPNVTTNRLSYNGGPSGVSVRPMPQEMAVLREQRLAPVQAQVQHARQFETNRAQFATVNHGRPAEVVAPQPLRTEYRTPAARPTEVPGHPAVLPVRPAPPQTRADGRSPEFHPQPQPPQNFQQGRMPVNQPRPFQPVPPQQRPENRVDVRQPAPVPMPPQQVQMHPDQPHVQGRGDNNAVAHQPVPPPQPRPEPQQRVERQEPPNRPMPAMQAQRPAPEEHGPVAKPSPMQPRPELRPSPVPVQREQMPAPAPQHQPRPEMRPQEQQRPMPAPQQQPRPQMRPQEQQRPMPAPPQQQRPMPAPPQQQRPEMRPQERPQMPAPQAPQPRPEVRQESHPAPAAHPAPPPQAGPHQEQHQGGGRGPDHDHPGRG